MEADTRVPDDLLDDVLERLEDLQLLRDESDQIDWTQLEHFPVDYYEDKHNGIGGPCDPHFDAGFHVGVIVTAARMLGIPVAALLKAARERERCRGRRPLSGTRSTTGGYEEGQPPPVPIDEPTRRRPGAT